MKELLIVIFMVVLGMIKPLASYAIYDPLSVPDNKYGIHILFPSELSQASILVNSSGGDWGYVTIPIQNNDTDLKKWQSFMNDCKKYHLIPIIRLSTEGDYFNTTVWSKPVYNDVLDFAGFLNSLSWPTKNRYVVVFNEVNRDDEWGGSTNAAEYAQILSFAVTTFKSKSPDFFIISAGMDNAAANSTSSINEYTFFYEMNQAVPGIFNQIDGFASHSYPNPGFSQPPATLTNESDDSFSFEKSYVENFTGHNLPVFITETGWSQDSLPSSTVASYIQYAYLNVWNRSDIVAVTPFILNAGVGPFAQFSLFDKNGNPNDIYKSIYAQSKTKGQPILTPSVLSASTINNSENLPVKYFNGASPSFSAHISNSAKFLLKWFLHYPNMVK